MTITPTILIQAAAAAAVADGVIFIGVQVNHPHSDVVSVTTTEWTVRNSLNIVMGALAAATNGEAIGDIGLPQAALDLSG
jgi:hypothetical protein